MSPKNTNPDSKTSTSYLRIDSFLSKAGLCSRRKAKTLISQGLINVNNTVCYDQSYKVDTDGDSVMYGSLVCKLVQKKVCFAFHKPKRVESTNQVQKEHKKRLTARSFLQSIYSKHLFSIGRLDYLSTGLLLFTNDGELCNRLLHPRFRIKKTYIIQTKTLIKKSILETWKRGIRIKEVEYTLHSYRYRKNNMLELCLMEGKNREIRCVLEHFAIESLMLQRIEFANIKLANLAEGAVRALHTHETETLYDLAYQELPA